MGKPVHIVTKQEKRLAHSAMERRYRRELNAQIKYLQQIVPSCNEVTTNLNKVIILKKATEYVKSLRQIEKDLVFFFFETFYHFDFDFVFFSFFSFF